MPALNIIFQDLIDQSLLLQHIQVLEFVAQDLNPIHASTTTRDILHFQLGRTKRIVQFLPYLLLFWVQVIRC